MAPYQSVFSDRFLNNFRRLTKKNSVLKDRVIKKVEAIVNAPSMGEFLSADLAGMKSVHVADHWVIVFRVDEKEETVEFLNFDHHDHAYFKKL